MFTVRDERLSIALAGLGGCEDLRGGSPRSLIEWCASMGFRAIQLDATLAGVRPRELDRSARRDLASLLRRLGLELSGIDLWIPPAHFGDPKYSQRAIDAALGACNLAADLAGILFDAHARPLVSLALPANLATSTVAELKLAAEKSGVVIADHVWPARPSSDDAPLRVGLDPATLIAAGVDPSAAALSPAPPAVAYRLTDFAAIGRVAPGDGSLDLAAFDVAMTTLNWAGTTTVDLRAMPNAKASVERLRQRLSDSSSPSRIVKFE